MTAKDVADIKELYEDLVRIGMKAQERGVKLIIDSEYRCVFGADYACRAMH